MQQDLILCSQFLMHSCISYFPPFSRSDHSSLELQIFVLQVNSIRQIILIIIMILVMVIMRVSICT